jgi:MerR family transcriptional regulator, light-induced transcriptional regulator
MDGAAGGGVRPTSVSRDTWGSSESLGRHAAERYNGQNHRNEAADRMLWLMRTIETEIIPRLMLAHKPVSLMAVAGRHAHGLVTGEEVAELARIVVEEEAAACVNYVDGIRSSGVALERIYTELLAPSARRLGELWEADLCDFTQVTLGLWRLQKVMYDLSPVFQTEAMRRSNTKRAMLLPVPGSQHTLGVFMVSEFFRRAGWEVWGEPNTSRADLVRSARTDWYDVIGFSVGAENQLAELTSVILAARQASRNRGVLIMVGGPIFVAHPEWAVEVGADLTARDAEDAVAQAENLVAQPVNPC